MSAIEQWHEVMKDGGKEGASKLDSLLHDDVIFYSPVVFTPQKGKKITMLYLSAASGVSVSYTHLTLPTSKIV